jgi:hypothetical protein
VGHYRVYCLDGANKVASADWIDAADDAAAVEAVRERFPRQKCELWDGPRLVGQIGLG